MVVVLVVLAGTWLRHTSNRRYLRNNWRRWLDWRPLLRENWSLDPDAQRLATRERDINRKARAAAEDDPTLAPDLVCRAATQLARDVYRAWTADDPALLGRFLEPGILATWTRRLHHLRARGRRTKIKVYSVDAHYVRFLNRLGSDDDRVVVRIKAVIDITTTDRRADPGTEPSVATRNVDEYWTLVRRNASWALSAVEQPAEGAYHLRSDVEIEPTDDARLGGVVQAELVAHDHLPSTIPHREIADLRLSPALRALDLSLIDRRLDPDVIRTSVVRALAAWVEASDGNRSQLAAMTTRNALVQLLEWGGSGNRVVLRNPMLMRFAIVAIDLERQPLWARVDLDVKAIVYAMSEPSREIIIGTDVAPRDVRVQWTLVLDGPTDRPWTIAHSHIDFDAIAPNDEPLWV